MGVFSPRFGWLAASQIPNRPQKWRDLAILIILGTVFVIQLAAITELERLKDELWRANPSKSRCFEWFLIGFTTMFVHQKNKNDFICFDYAHWIRSEMVSNRFLQPRKCISRGVAFLFLDFRLYILKIRDFTVFGRRIKLTFWKTVAKRWSPNPKNHVFSE